jgi:hypothetical protein
LLSHHSREKKLLPKEMASSNFGIGIGLRKWCQLYAGEMDQARILVEVLRRQN